MPGWIGVDLDGTLAHYDRWQGPEHIGEPIPLMLDRVKQWMNEGIEVRIVTARAAEAVNIPYIQHWLHEQGIGGLSITNCKDFGMLQLWDDRAIQVISNTGEVAGTIPKTLQQREFADFSSQATPVIHHDEQAKCNQVLAWLKKLLRQTS